MSKRVEDVRASDEKPEEKVEKDEAPAQSGLLVYPLSHPITAYGEKISVVKMRRPRPNDVMEVGNPVIFFPHAEPVRVEHDYNRVIAMVARLSEPSIPSSSLSAGLDLNDLVGLAWAISPFFTPAR